MGAPVRSSTLKSGIGISTGDALLSNTITGAAAGNALIAITAAHKIVTSGDLVSAVSGMTLVARSKVIGGGTTTEIAIWLAYNITAGTQTATLTLVNAATDVTWHFDEYSGLLTGSTPADKTSTGSSPTNSASVSTGSTATLVQASELVIAAAANRYNYIWGATFGNPQPPSPLTKLQGTDNNSTTVPMVSGWRDVSSTAAVSATFAQANQGDNGAVAAIATFKYLTATKKVRIKFDTAVAGTTGWTVYAWRGDPNAMVAEVKVTGVTVGAGGVTDIDAGTLGDLADTTAVNVIAYQPAGTKQGTAFGPGSIVSV